MKKISFLLAGTLTTVLAIATTGCSDNSADRTPSTPPDQDGAAYSSRSVSSDNGTSASIRSGTDASIGNGTNTSMGSGTNASVGDGSGDVSSQYMLDPTGSGPGE